MGVAGLYHLLAIIVPALHIHGPHTRHAVFAVIDAGFACLLLLRPWWALIPFAFLTGYSLYSHGRHAWQQWQLEGRLDWLSLGVVIVMPIMLAMLAVDARRRHNGTR